MLKRSLRFLMFAPLLAITLFATTAGANETSRISPELLDAFDRLGDDARLSIHIVMEEQADPRGLLQTTRRMSREVRRRTVVDELKTFSRKSQSDLLNTLKEMAERGEVSDISALWILNAVSLTA